MNNELFMRPLHIIMPMAGEGSRFLKEGITTPKPFILAKGIPFFIRAISSLNNIEAPRKYSFIVRQEHINNFEIDKKMLEYFPEANIILVEKTTRGAVETCMLAQDFIEKEDGILVLDCDLEFKSIQFEKLVTESLTRPPQKINGGALVSFQSNNPRYSYALTNSHNKVIETAEKEVISENALAGAYFFAIAESFLSASKQLLKKSKMDKPEYYVSLLYNTLIQNGEIVQLAKTDQYHSFGTPEELKHFTETKS